MERKYELTDRTIELDGRTLHLIRALKDFGDVKAGDLGGWIESESNLSHEGNCWVYDDAKVYDNAKVYGNARLSEYARVFGNAKVFTDAWVRGSVRVYGNAFVGGNASVHGNVFVSGNTKVYGDAEVFGDTQIYGKAEVYGAAKVCGNAMVFRNAKVYGNASVYGSSRIFGNAKVYENARVCEYAEVYGNARVGINASLTGYVKVHDIADKYFLSHDINYSMGLKWGHIDFSSFNKKYSGFSEIQMYDDNDSSVIEVFLKGKKFQFIFRAVFSDVSIFELNDTCFIKYKVKCYLKDKKDNYNRAFKIVEQVEQYEISVKDAIDIIKDTTNKKFEAIVSKNTVHVDISTNLESKIRNYVVNRINRKLSTIIDEYYTQS